MNIRVHEDDSILSPDNESFMEDWLTQMNSKERFSNRVEDYVKYRPGYPDEAMDYLVNTVGLTPPSHIADIGSGTGIFTRLLLDRAERVYAIEPNKEMREAAESLLGGYPGFVSVDASAEETTLPDQSVQFITIAQAFHWFNLTLCQKEFRRILVPEGRVILIWNKRVQQQSEFARGYEELVREYGNDYQRVQHGRVSETDFKEFFREGIYQQAVYSNNMKMDYEKLQGRLRSSSYCPLPGEPHYLPLMEKLKKLFDQCQQDGQVEFDYQTELYWGRV